MATKLQDLQAKRKELQATNPNATMLDAKSAISPIQNAPVAWQAPTPINSVATWPADRPSQIINWKDIYNFKEIAWNQDFAKDTQWMNVEERQKYRSWWLNRIDAMQSKNLRDMNQWAIDKMGNIPDAVQQAGTVKPPIEQMKPETTTPSWATMNPDWTVTQSSNPISTTPSVSNKPTKTEVIPPPVTIGDMYNNLVNRIDVPPEQKALPTYKIAQNRYNKANMFSSMTPAELSTEMKSAKLVEWSPAWEDLKVMNPELVRSTKALNTANGIKPEIFTYINNPDGTKVKQNNLEQSFVSDYNDNYSDIVKILTDIYNPDTAQEARDKIYTPEVRQAEERATEYELKMIAKLDEMAMIDKDVEKEMAGTGATGSRIALEKSYRNEQLQNQYNSLQKTYTAFANKANNLITQNTDLYDKERQNKQALNTALAGIAVKGYEAQQAEKIAQATLNDPTKAIPALIEQYTKLWVPMQRSVQEMIQEAQNEIANGWTLASYLTKLQQTIQSKPEYKRIQAQEAGKGISYQTIWDKVYKNENGVLTETDISTRSTRPDWVQDTTTGTWIDKNTWTRPDIQALSQAKWQNLLDAPDGIVIPSRLSETTNKNGGKECAEYVNDITWIGLWNSWDSKKSKIDNTIIVPETGDTAIWIPDPSNKTFAKYGHAWVVTWVSEDGSTVTIKSSNLNWDGAISTITVPISQIDQTWGFAHSSVKQTGTQSTEITQGDISIFNNTTFKPQTDLKTQAQKDKYKKFLEEKNNVMSYNNKDVDIKSILAYSAWGKELTDATIKPLEKFNSALDQIGSIQEQISKMDTWPILGRLRNLNPYDTDAQVLKAQLTALMPTVARWVYWEVWVLTDSDIRLYAQTIPNLTNTNDVNKAVLAMSLKVIAWGYKRQLQTLAAAWKDVSGFSGIYDWLMSQVQSLESEIGVGWTGSGTNDLDSIYNSL